MDSILRRTFVGVGSALALRAAAGRRTTDKPAILGGDPVRQKGFPEWPQVDDTDERNIVDALRACKWWRKQGHYVRDFEQAWAKRMGAKHCIAVRTAPVRSSRRSTPSRSGRPGDEVLVGP